MMYPALAIVLPRYRGATSQKAILGIRRRRAKRETTCTLVSRFREIGRRTEKEEVEEEDEEKGEVA